MPSPIVATHVNLATSVPTRTRPLCRYPNVARYDGSGSIDDVSNFVCVESD